jgi:hypothetical protein
LWDRLDDYDLHSSIENTYLLFNKLFDSIYGERHFSLKCMIRSCLFSIAGVSIIKFSIINLKSGHSLIIGIEDPFLKELNTILFVYFFLIFIPINLVADYFSLIETRIILKFCYNKRTSDIIGLLIIDILLSLLCFFIGYHLIHNVIISGYPFVFTVSTIAGSLTFRPQGIESVIKSFYDVNFITPFLYSTFLTSFTFYIFIAITFIMTLSAILKPPLSWMLERLAAKNPITALGAFLMLLLTLIHLIKYLLT